MRYYYKSPISAFLNESNDTIIGKLVQQSPFSDTQEQKSTWVQQLQILKSTLPPQEGEIYFEYSIPRMGKRIDALLVLPHVVLVLEFKVGASKRLNADYEQVYDYALDLKNFHEPSHHVVMVPVLIPTLLNISELEFTETARKDGLFRPIVCATADLPIVFRKCEEFFSKKTIELESFHSGSYRPTPTIIEAAISLFNGHTVEEITRKDAGAKNLSETTTSVANLINRAHRNQEKIICFVTGVPGAGKTLVGLKVAIEHLDEEKGQRSVYLSGNGPLVQILQEALVRDKVAREKLNKKKITKQDARSSVKTFVQNIHHYRDEYVKEPHEIPYDHVAIFDEAQRAWNMEMASQFMQRKKNIPGFNMSEPEFLISCLDRHKDWAVIVCLVGGGQEINTGEAGISEWLKACRDIFPHWKVYLSPQLADDEYQATSLIKSLDQSKKVQYDTALHLAVSMRSYRAEFLSEFVHRMLSLEEEKASHLYSSIKNRYPLVMTRNIEKGKSWLKEMARGSERYGIVVSSQAYRLKPLAIDIRSQIDPVHWFLNDRDDVRSSYFLEDVATEFQVQGLELDWVCVAWDGDLRMTKDGWDSYSFVGTKWQRILKDTRKQYLLNAYRVLLTRARQGMVIVIPEGNDNDQSRKCEFYDGTYTYFKELGIQEIN